MDKVLCGRDLGLGGDSGGEGGVGLGHGFIKARLIYKNSVHLKRLGSFYKTSLNTSMLDEPSYGSIFGFYSLETSFERAEFEHFKTLLVRLEP